MPAQFLQQPLCISLLTTITIMSNRERKNIKQELPCNLNQSFKPLSVLTAISASSYTGTASQPLPSAFFHGWNSLGPHQMPSLSGAINSYSEDKRILLALVVQHSLYPSLIFSIGSPNSFGSMMLCLQCFHNSNAPANSLLHLNGVTFY